MSMSCWASFFLFYSSYILPTIFMVNKDYQYHLFVIFAVLNVSFVVNMCLNCSFFTFIFAVLLHCCRCYMVQGTCFKMYRQTKFHSHRTTSGEDMTSYRFSYYFRFVSNETTHTLPKAKIYLQTKFRRYISINAWDIAASCFGKQTSWFWPYRSNRHVILRQSTKLHPNHSIRGGDMTSYRFLTMAAAAAQYYFRFPNCWRKVKFYYQTKWRWHSSVHSWDITSSVLEKGTSAILEFYFRFRFHYITVIGNRHVILHQSAKYHLYQTTHCENITSYRFFKMSAAAAQYYFRFRVCWCCCLQKAKICQQNKFRKHTSIHGWDITTSGLEKQTSAILEFYFRFYFRPLHRNHRVILRQAAEFRPNRILV